MNAIDKLRHAILEEDLSKSSWLRRTIVFLVRLLYGIVLNFADPRLHLQSTSLAYTTLLSFVPLLAATFSVLKGFGVQNQLEPMLMQALEPLGEKGAEIGQNILNYVNNLNFAVLGFMGLALLFWTVISLLQKVEEAFNSVWHVPRMRSWSRRFSDYLSVTLVGPVFIVTALGLTTVVLHSDLVQSAAGIKPFGWIVLGVGRLMPYLLVCAAFAFLYSFLTNTRVRLVPALAGGIFASIAWYGVGHLFASLVANSSKYSAIYSSLAAVVLFIIWVNIGWLIILVGAHIARYSQNPRLLRFIEKDTGVSVRCREAAALDVMTVIGRAYYFDDPKWTLDALVARGGAGSYSQIEDLLQSLMKNGLIVATQGDPEAYVPARAIETILLRDIVSAAAPVDRRASSFSAVQKIIEQMDRRRSDVLGTQTLRDLVPADRERIVGSASDDTKDPEQE